MFDKPKVDTYAPTIEPPAGATRIAILTADDCQDLEFFYPYYRFCEENYAVDVITPKGGEVKGKLGTSLQSTRPVSNCFPADYALLYLPGGKAPAHIRKDEACLNFVREFAVSGKPIAAICHAAQILVSAGLARGRKLAAWPEVKDEITEAGGTFVNEPLVEDGQLITARWPGDLPLHVRVALQRVNAQAAFRQKPAA